MPNVLKQYFKPLIDPPVPPEQGRVIHSELIHSFEPKTPIITLGAFQPENTLQDSITVSLSHAF